MQKMLSSIRACVLAAAMITGITQVAGQVKPSGATAPASATAVSLPASLSGGVKVNYVRSRETIGPITDTGAFNSATYRQVRTTTQYLDGLGRPIQTVAKQASPAAKDLISPFAYDAFGREAFTYAPYVTNDSSGGFRLSTFTEQATFMATQYPGENIFYAETQFENAQSNRIVKALAPGNSWGGQGKGVAHAYLVSQAADSVCIWTIGLDTLLYSGTDATVNVPSTSGFYQTAQLLKTQTTDEQGSRVIEYKDREGHVVLKKVQAGFSPGTAHVGWLSTYYVYDDFGLLRFVIPPKTVAVMQNNGNWLLSADEIMDELCFRYEYDARGRMIAKKVPGAGWVYMVYDNRDRLAYTQDANMRLANHWLATLFDGQNRVTGTGMITYSGNRGALQWIVDIKFNDASATEFSMTFMAPDSMFVNERQPGKPVYRAKSKVIFTGEFASEDPAEYETILADTAISTTTVLLNYNPIPAGGDYVALTLNYYDDYSFTDKTYKTADTSNIDNSGNAYPEWLPSSASLLTRGMLTGTKVRILNNPTDVSAGGWLESASFYDDKGRVVQAQSENITNGTDVVTTRYDFTGKPITLYQVHNNAITGLTVKSKTNLLYDHAGRLGSIKKTINNNDATARWIERNAYDELGQLKEKKIGQRSSDDTDPMETQDHTYNIRGWLQSVNGAYSRGTGTKWFGMELNYDWGFTAGHLNGNIAGQQWRSRGDGERRAFGYSYDSSNRILVGDFTQYDGSAWNTSAGLDFSLSNMNYDANGNILSMSQSGWKVNGSSLIDQLSYTYKTTSNKLLNVIDAQNDTATKLGDFRSSKAYMTALGNSKTTSAADYTYDDNGNLLKDLNKEIGSSTPGITYNHLNLPASIWVKGKGTITYYYDATGNKLEKRTYDSTVSQLIRTTYVNGYVYKNDTLQFLSHEDGRIRKKTDNSLVYDYFLKDHLGNTRMVLTEEYEQNTYPVATLEDDATTVEGNYYNIDPTKIVLRNSITNFNSATGSGYKNNNGNPPYNTNPTSIVTNTSDKLYKINGSSGNKTGLGITIKVMSGDTVSIFGRSYWHSNGTAPTNTYNSAASDLFNVLVGNGGLVASAKGISAGDLSGSSTITNAVSDFLTDGSRTPGSTPKAYINWVLFDEQLKIVNNSSGFRKMSSISDVIDSMSQAVDITRNGYLYVYCSNESNNDVFFDNFQVIHNKGPLLEETHYYPFGLTMAGISSKSAGKLENRFKYNGIELDEDLGIDTYEAQFRNLNVQIGRWWQIDPKGEGQESESPYTSMANDPVKMSDPLGDVPCCKELWGDIKSAAKETWGSIKQTASDLYTGTVNLAREGNAYNPLASGWEIITGKSTQSDFSEAKPRSESVADLGVNTIMLLTGEIGAGGKAGATLSKGTKVETEVVQRAMSKGELEATKETGLVRGGREGTHHVSDAVGNDATKVRQRLALPQTPEVKVSMEVPKGSFSKPSPVTSKYKMPGGGTERTATGNIPAKVVKVKDLKN
jgi:RHS repeat-associated protein